MKLHKWRDIRSKSMSPEKIRALDAEVQQELLEMDLRALREAAGLTQGELAEKLETSQAQLSKLERREDHRVSTLREVVKALGGELEVTAVINGKRIRVAGA